MKRVLHIITGLGQGGAESVLYRLCCADRSVLHQVICLTGPAWYGPRLVAEGIGVHCLNMSPGRVRLPDFLRLCRLIREARADVVQCWMYHADLLGGLAARWVGHRNLIWGIRHSGFAPGVGGRATRWVRWLCARLSAVLPRRIICCAHSSLEVHHQSGYALRRMCVVPNGVDPSGISAGLPGRAAVRASLGIPPQTPLIGMIARYHPQKDHGTLLAALALLRQGQSAGTPAPLCLLAGTGMERGNVALMQLARGYGVGDALLLLGPRHDVPQLLAALDIHVLSSHSGEACPNVLLEAMACGTPCVATDVGDAARIIGDTGHIVPHRHPAQLAMAVANLLHECGTPAWSARQAAARARIEVDYRLDQMVSAYHAVWFGEDEKRPDGRAVCGSSFPQPDGPGRC